MCVSPTEVPPDRSSHSDRDVPIGLFTRQVSGMKRDMLADKCRDEVVTVVVVFLQTQRGLDPM